MPVIGVPIGSGGGSATQAAPAVTQLFGIPQPAKMRSVTVVQGSAPEVVWTMVDAAGDPVDLTAWEAVGYTVRLAVSESLLRQGCVPLVVDGSVVNPPGTDGAVQAALPTDPPPTPGIYRAEFALARAGDGALLLSNSFWLVVERSLFGDQSLRGPPSLAEIRLHLRDAPEGNRLLDEYEFDVAEIAASISAPVDWFNEVEPPLDQRYTTVTFPWRYHWKEAIVAELFTTAAHYYRRNKFNYTAGGMQVSSIDKEQEYMRAAGYHRERWETWARKTKVRANMEAAFLTHGSPYGR